MNDEPLFRDSEHCVRFAFAICEHTICSVPSYLRALIGNQPKKSGRVSGMTAHDWHAQGALIRKRVAALEPMLAAYGYACYSWGQERGAALQMMDGYVTQALPTVKNHKLLGLLVRRYVDRGRGKRVSMAEIARTAGVHHSWASDIDRRIGDVLDELHFGFFERLDRQFHEAGLIPEPVVYA